MIARGDPSSGRRIIIDDPSSSTTLSVYLGLLSGLKTFGDGGDKVVCEPCDLHLSECVCVWRPRSLRPVESTLSAFPDRYTNTISAVDNGYCFIHGGASRLVYKGGFFPIGNQVVIYGLEETILHGYGLLHYLIRIIFDVIILLFWRL